MQKKKFLLALLVVPMCLLIWSCGDDDKSSKDNGDLALCQGIAENFIYAGTVITDVESVKAGDVLYSSSEAYTAPDHCVVTGYMNERTGTGIAGDTTYAIGFEMRLPVDWNGRFYYQANGGVDGSVKAAVGRFMGSNGSDTAALGKGFAVISSDAGHPSALPFFGLDPQARLDYGYNAVKELTPMAKEMISFVYGQEAKYSYFGGCSNGGRHTMVAASRYSDMYDGFLSGDPGFNLPQAAVAQIYGIQQYATLVDVNTTQDKDAEGKITAEYVLSSLEGAITPAEFKYISQRVLAVCDDLDGATDGMINATYACQEQFDLDSDVRTCEDENRTGQCLTADQKHVLANIMAGTDTTVNNEIVPLYTSFPYDAGMSGSNWSYWEYQMALTRDTGAIGFIFSSPPTPFNGATENGNYDFIQNFDIASDAARIYATSDPFNESAMQFMTMPDPTLAQLQANGDKILVVHGTSDPVFSVNDTVNWYEGLGGDVSSYARLFLVPGMNHCGGGPTTDRFDALESLMNWVEEGVAPENVEASVRADNAELPSDWSTERGRPLCPYPQVATYIGGDIDSAASFVCEEP